MMWFGDGVHGAWGIAGMVMMGVFWLGLLALAWVAIDRLTGRRGSDSDKPEDILKRRLARGDITAEEFDRLRQTLR